MADFLTKAKTVLLNWEMLTLYLRWISYKVFKQDPKIKTNLGFKVGHLRHFNEFWSVKNNIYGFTIEQEYKFLKKLLVTEDYIFDIGANVGTFSLMLTAVNKNIHIHAFEPIPSTFSILNSNLASNGIENVTTKNMALSDRSGLISFVDIENSPSQNKIFPDNSNQISESNHIVIKVPSTTLDAYCAEESIDFLRFVKIDVEGAELLVLRGAEQMLTNKKIGALLIEVIPKAIHDMGFTEKDLYDFITNLGYGIYRINDDGIAGEEVSLEAMKQIRDDDNENLLLLPIN